MRRPAFWRSEVAAATVIALALSGVACGQRSPTTSIAVSTPRPIDVAEERRFRETFGLRADDHWIAQVANDPSSQASIEQFGVRLLPSELSEVIARTTSATQAGPIILAYAAKVPDDWYGSYIDQERGGMIVAQFLKNTDHHRDALERILPPSARWEAREVDQRTLDMIEFVGRVKGESDWFTTVDAELLDVVTNPLYGGVVELTYLSRSRQLDPLILAHFGSPEWLRVERAGGPPWAGPVGDLEVRALDLNGKPVPRLTCSIGGDTAVLTDADGICRYPDVAAVEQRIQLWAGIEESRYVVGSAAVVVRPDDLTSVTIVVLP